MVKKRADKQTNDELLDRVFQIWYGLSHPTLNDKARASYTVIAKYLKQDPKLVSNLAQRYFRILKSPLKRVKKVFS